MSRSRRGALPGVQRALGWTKGTRRDVGPEPSCLCGEKFQWPIDSLGRVDYKRPYCPLRERCPARESPT